MVWRLEIPPFRTTAKGYVDDFQKYIDIRDTIPDPLPRPFSHLYIDGDRYEVENDDEDLKPRGKTIFIKSYTKRRYDWNADVVVYYKPY